MNDVTVTLANMMFCLLLGFWLSLDRPSISVTLEPLNHMRVIILCSKNCMTFLLTRSRAVAILNVRPCQWTDTSRISELHSQPSGARPVNIHHAAER